MSEKLDFTISSTKLSKLIAGKKIHVRIGSTLLFVVVSRKSLFQSIKAFNLQSATKATVIGFTQNGNHSHVWINEIK